MFQHMINDYSCVDESSIIIIILELYIIGYVNVTEYNDIIIIIKEQVKIALISCALVCMPNPQPHCTCKQPSMYSVH